MIQNWSDQKTTYPKIFQRLWMSLHPLHIFQPPQPDVSPSQKHFIILTCFGIHKCECKNQKTKSAPKKIGSPWRELLQVQAEEQAPPPCDNPLNVIIWFYNPKYGPIIQNMVQIIQIINCLFHFNCNRETKGKLFTFSVDDDCHHSFRQRHYVNWNMNKWS